MKGCQGSNQHVLAPSFLKVVSFAMMVSIGLGYYFGGKSFRRLGSWTINIGFKTGEGLLGSFARVLHSEVLCAHHTVRLVPKFSRHIPVNTKKGMSSSDSISLSTSSSSESTESERSRGRQFDEDGTSYGVMTSGIPMETVREVREDPLEELAESDWPAKGGYGWAAADVRNQSSLEQSSPRVSVGTLFLWRGLVPSTRYAMGRRVLPRSFSTCICVISLNFMCDCR